MTAPVIGATSTPRLTAYLSVDMFKNDGRRGVSVDQLVSGGRPAAQDAALLGYIESASGYMDSFCQQTLAATYDTQVKLVNVDRRGFIRVHPRYTPVIAVTAFAIGSIPSQLATMSSLQGTGVGGDFFQIPANAGALPTMTNQGPLQFGQSLAVQRDQSWAQFTYVNGYPVTSLTAPVGAGDVVISVEDTTGIVAGNTWLTIYAGARRFRFLAGAVSTAGVNGIGTGPGTVVCPSVPLSIPNVGEYPTMVSALPPDVIQACVLATRSFIKDQVPGTTKEGAPTAGDDLIEVAGLLRAFVAPVE